MTVSKRSCLELIRGGEDAFAYVAKKRAKIALNRDHLSEVRAIRESLVRGELSVDECRRLLNEAQASYHAKFVAIDTAEIGNLRKEVKKS